MNRISILYWLAALLVVTSPVVASGDPLPEPLTLEAALATASNPTHFELRFIDQRIEALNAQLGIQQSQQGFSLDLTGRIREVGPSNAATDDDGSDNAASLVLSKPLYDFGLGDSRVNQLNLQLTALQYQKQLIIEQRRLSIRARYFDVLNADNRFISENEALAMGFIRYDNAREAQELGKAAEIDVLRLQSAYEVIRQKRQQAVQQQRLSRAILAETMGYPDQLSSDLEIPDITTARNLPGEFDSMLEQALQNSTEARVVRANTRAAQSAISIAGASDNPSLELELEVSSYQRDSRLRDDWRAGLYFEVPLFSSQAPAASKLAKARYQQALASEQQLASQLRIELLELWQRLLRLQLEIQGNIVEQDFRDLYLDRSRAEYELEFRSDLGDSMVLYSRSNDARLRSLYAFDLAYEQLTALLGNDFLNQAATTQ